MALEKRDDRDLIAAYLRGEAEAVAAMEVLLLRAARSYRRRLDHCWEDLLQDLQLEIYRLLHAGHFHGESALATYLWRVVSHTCLDRIRSQGRRRETDLEEEGLGDLSALVSSQRRQWNDSLDLVQRVLTEVPGECRRLWQMILAGHSYREMSTALEIAEGTLRVRVLRCRKKALAARDRLLGVSAAAPRM
jgi:RNA polymerase sigma-70 factor (ECF subfamily)